MRYRTIGTGAVRVAAIGLGCMPMSWAYSASQRDRQGSLRTVRAALDAGCTVLDTADMYGPYTNELLLGRVLRERRDEVFLAAKCGLLAGDRHIVANGRPAYIKRACDASLRRLRTDVIDLYQLHRIDPEVPVEETWGRCQSWWRRGRYGRSGCARWNRAAVAAGAAAGRAARWRTGTHGRCGCWPASSRSSR